MIMGVWGLGRKKGWTNPYVTDGLIAMWDGEWNAGGGVHDPNATAWKDLVGGNMITPTVLAGGIAAFGAYSLTLDNAIALSQEINAFDPSMPFSIELVIRQSDTGYSMCMSPATSSIYAPVLEAGINNGKFTFGVRNRYNPIASGIDTGSVSLAVGPTSQTCFANGVPYNTRATVNGYGKPPIALGYSPARDASPTTAGRSEYLCIRIYATDITADTAAHNYAIDKQRFDLP